MKRETMMLAQKYVEQDVEDWLVSVKLDGCRAWWDGGVSRGVACADVPYANTIKDARFREAPVATGLWSRYFNPIAAPTWFTADLPSFCLDGELWAGNGRHQFVRSTVSRHTPVDEDWKQISFKVFEAPPFDVLTAPGSLRLNNGLILKIRPHGWKSGYSPRGMFLQTYNWLREQDLGSASLIKQFKTTDLAGYMEGVVEAGGEGLVLRNPFSVYSTTRSKNLLKYKNHLDAEAVVVGCRSGKITDKGSRLLGMMGSLQVRWRGLVFEIGTGFSDSDRRLVDSSTAAAFPGTLGYTSEVFPVGCVITFKYRELTVDSVPKEARYVGIRTD